MDPVQKAIWFIDGHLDQAICLDDVAEVAGLSRHHLVRAFSQVTGRSVIRYLRARRLTEAARALAAGAPDILTVALDAGYGSHEAFTRAFRDLFGVTPEQVRSAGCTRKLQLVEPIVLRDPILTDFARPRLVEAGPILLVGLIEHYRSEDMAAIPNQWRRFTPWFGNIPAQRRDVSYGVICNGDDDGAMDYLTAAEVNDFSGAPDELARLRLAPQRYAVFAHAGHVSQIRSVWRTIWGEWLPSSGARLADAPFFEFYPERFEPQSGEGGFEVWLPLES